MPQSLFQDYRGDAKAFTENVLGQNKIFNFEKTDFSTTFSIEVVQDVTSMDVHYLGQYGSKIQSYAVYVAGLVSQAEGEYDRVCLIAKRYVASLVKSDTKSLGKITLAKELAETDETLQTIRDLELELQITYRDLDRKLKSLEKLYNMVSREYTRRGIEQ